MVGTLCTHTDGQTQPAHTSSPRRFSPSDAPIPHLLTHALIPRFLPLPRPQRGPPARFSARIYISPSCWLWPVVFPPSATEPERAHRAPRVREGEEPETSNRETPPVNSPPPQSPPTQFLQFSSVFPSSSVTSREFLLRLGKGMQD